MIDCSSYAICYIPVTYLFYSWSLDHLIHFTYSVKAPPSSPLETISLLSVFVLFGLVWFSILFNVSKRNLLLAANKFGHLHLSLSAKSTSIQSFLQAGIEGKETPLPGSGLIILPALNSGTSLLPCGGLGNKDISQHYEAGFFLLAFTKHVQHIHSAPLHLSLPLSPWTGF